MHLYLRWITDMKYALNGDICILSHIPEFFLLISKDSGDVT